ncbi:MAG: Ig-like domain-containing protein, partial [Christensenellales bacterium]
MKRKLVLILTVILLAAIVGAILTACNEEPTKISDLYGDEVNASSSEITKAYAWRKIYNGLSEMAKESVDATYLNFDTTIYFTFLRDGVGSKYYVTLAGTIDVYDNQHSKFLLELGTKKSEGEDGEKPILGLYYLDELLYVDMTAISGGSHVLKADDIDLAKLATIVKSLTKDLDIIGTIDGLLQTEIPALGKIESVITSLLFGKSTLTDLGNGEERVDVELSFGNIIGVALGLVQNMLAGYQDVLLVIKQTFGLDLTNLNALIPNLSATLTAYFKNSEMSGIDLKAGIDYDVTHSPREVDIEVGFTTAEIESIQRISLPDYIKEAETKDFSFTTVSIDADVSVSTQNNTISIGGVMDSLGSLLTGILSKQIQDLIADKNINFEGSIYKLSLSIRGQLNFKDNAKTNLVFEITGGVAESKRLGLYYIGQDETLYLDLEGILGTGSRYKLDKFNLIETIDDAIMGMLGGEATQTSVGSIADSVAYIVSEYTDYVFTDGVTMDKAAMYDMVKDMILTGSVKDAYGANGEYKIDKAALASAGKSATTVLSAYTLTNEASSAAIDTSNLTAIIAEVISNVEIVMGDQGLLNLKRFSLSLSNSVINKIVKMFDPKAELPIDSASIALERNNPDEASLVLRVSLASPFDNCSVRVSADITYGSLTTMRGNKELSDVLESVKAKQSSYLDLARDDDGNFKLEEIYISLKGEFDLYTASGDFTDIQYRDVDSVSTMLLQLVMKLDNTTQDKFAFLIEGNLNLSDFLASDLHIAISNVTLGETYAELYYINKVIYLDLTYFNIAKVKVDISDFLKSGDEATTTGEEAKASEIDMAAIVAAIIAGGDIGADYLEIYLAGSLISNLLEVLDLDDKLIVGNAETMVGGLRLSFGDGLNLNKLKVNLYLSSGNRMDMNFTVKDFTVSAAVTEMEAPDYRLLTDSEKATFRGTRYSKKTTESGKLIGYVVDSEGLYCESGYNDFMESPYFYVGIDGDLDLNVKAGQVDLDEGIAGLLSALGIVIDNQISSLVVEEAVNIDYKFDLQLSVDFSPLIQFLKDEATYNTMVETGSMFANNKTQFKLNLSRTDDGGLTSKTVIGLYYIGGKLYVDIEYLGLEKIALEVNIFELLMQVIIGNDWLQSLSPVNSEASTTAIMGFDTKYTDENGEIKNYDIALLLSVAMSDTRFLVEVADGLTQLVLNKLGVGFAGISAGIELRYKDTEEIVDDVVTRYESELKGSLAIKNEKNEDMISLSLNVNAPSIEFSQKDIENLEKSIGAGYQNVALFNDDGTINLEGLYLELEGSLIPYAYQSDSEGGENNWNIGEWIKSLYTTDSPALESLLYQLLATFEIPAQVSSTLGFKISALLRLDLSGINVKEKTFNLNSLLNFDYILSHSDIAIEIWDGKVNATGSKKAFAIYLVYAGENNYGQPYSTLYLDVEMGIMQNTHIMLDGFDLGKLLGLFETKYDYEMGVKIGEEGTEIPSDLLADAKVDELGNFTDLKVESGNETVAVAEVVGGTVKVIGKAKGEVALTISYTNKDGGSESKKIKITVVDFVTREIKKGDTLATPWVPFENPTGKVTVVSSDDSIATATVTPAGAILVTAHKAGCVTVTATYDSVSKVAFVRCYEVTDEAVTSGEETSDTSSDNSSLNLIAMILSTGISAITLNQDALLINFSTKFIAVLLAQFIPSLYMENEDGTKTLKPMVELNSERSYIEINTAAEDLEISLGIDPLQVALSIEKPTISFNRQSIGQEINKSDYIALLDLSQFSLSFSIDIQGQLKNSKEEENGVIEIDNYIKALISDLVLDFGLDIQEDIYLDMSLEIEASINTESTDDTQLYLVLRDNTNGKVLFGVYILGTSLYVELGSLSEDNFVMENINVGELVSKVIVDLVKDLTTSVTQDGEAETTESAEEGDAAKKALEFVVGIASKEISLTLGQNLIFAILNFVINNGKPEEEQVDIDTILDKMVDDNGNRVDLGLTAELSLDTSIPEIRIGIDSKIIAASISITRPYIAVGAAKDRYSEIKLNEVDNFLGYYVKVNDSYYQLTKNNVYKDDGSGNLTLISSDPVKASGSDPWGAYRIKITANAEEPVTTANTLPINMLDGFEKLQSIGEKLSDAVSRLKSSIDKNGNSTLNNFDENPCISFAFDFYFNYALDATFVEMTQSQIASGSVPKSDRYSLSADGIHFVQDENGTYQRVAREFQEILDATLNLDIINDLIKGLSFGSDDSKVTLKDLLKTIAFKFYVDDAIDSTLILTLKGNIDLEKLGIYKVINGNMELSDFIGDFSLAQLLAACEFGIELCAMDHSRQAIAGKSVGIYLVDNYVLLDLKGIDGPRAKISADKVFDLFSGDDSEASTTDDEEETLSGTKLVAAVLNAIVKTVVVKAKLRTGATLKTFDSFDIMFNSDMLQAVVALFSDNSVNLSRFNLDESCSGIFLKLADEEFDGKPSLSVGMQTVDGLKLKLSLAAAFTIDVGATTSILGVGVTHNDFADLTKFETQTYNLSVDGKLYISSDGSATYDLSQFVNSSDMLASYFGDMIVTLMSDQQFYSAVGVRIGANFNLGDLFLDYFTSNGYELISDWEAREENVGYKFSGTKYSLVENVDEEGNVIETTYEEDSENGIYKKQYSLLDFLKNSELRSLEIALELLELDTYGNYKYDSDGNVIVKGGLYLAQDTLYLDGRELFPGAPAAYIPNIVSVIENAIKGVNMVADKVEDIGEAVTSADSIDAANQAVLELIMSDPAIQLVLTKSFFAVILSMIMPSLGDIGDIFDVLNMSLSLEKGKFSYETIDFSKLCEDTRFSRSYEEKSDAGKYAYDKNGNKYVEIIAIAECGENGESGTGYYIVNGNKNLIYLASEFKYYERHNINLNVYYENENGEFEVSGGLYYEKLDWSEEILKQTSKRYSTGYYKFDTSASGKGLEKDVDYANDVPANLYSVIKADDGKYYVVLDIIGKDARIGDTDYVTITAANTIGRYVEKDGVYYDLTKYIQGGVTSVTIDGTEFALDEVETYNDGWYQDDNGLYAKAENFNIVSNQAFRQIYVGNDGLESDWTATRYSYGYFAESSIAATNTESDLTTVDQFYFCYNNEFYKLNDYIWYSDEAGTIEIPISQRTASNVINVKCVNITESSKKVKVSEFETVSMLAASGDVFLNGTSDYTYFFYKGYYVNNTDGDHKWVEAEYSLILPYEERYTEITYFREYESGDYIFDDSDVDYYVELASLNADGSRTTITKEAYDALSEAKQAMYGAIGSFILYDNLTAEKKEQFALSTRYQKVSDYYLFSYLVAHADDLYVEDINGYYGKTVNADGTFEYETFNAAKHTLRYSKAVNSVSIVSEVEANSGKQEYEEKIVGTYVELTAALDAYENVAIQIDTNGTKKYYVIYDILTDELKESLSSSRYVATIDIFTYAADGDYTYPDYVVYNDYKDFKLTNDKYLSQLIGSEDRMTFMENNYLYVNTTSGYVLWKYLTPQQMVSYKDHVKYVLDYSVSGSKYDLRNEGEKVYGSYALDITGSEYMRRSVKYTSISDYGITLGIKAGTFGFGVSIGGLTVGFGSSATLLPNDINEAIPFTKSTIGLGADITLYGDLTAGTIDFGQVFSAILGDLSGVVIEAPEYTTGITKMNFKMSVSAILDLSDIAKSELKVELISVSAMDVEEIIIGVYYQDGSLFINAEKLGLPKMVINELEFITDTLNGILVDIFGEDVYDAEEIQNEASTSDDSKFDAALAILISNKHFSVRLGKELIDFVLGLIKIGDSTLQDFVYDGIDYSGFADVKVSIDDLEATELNTEISFRMGVGSKYVQVAIKDVLTAEGTLTPEAENALNDVRTANSLDKALNESNLILFIEDPNGVWAYDSENKIYVKATSVTSGDRYTPYAYGTAEFNAVLATAEKVDDKTIYYVLIEGESANYDTYEKQVNFSLGIDNVSIKFAQTDRTRPLSDEEIAEYTLYSEIENIVLSERLDITTYLDGGDLELSEWVQLFFQDESLADLEGIIKVMEEDGDYIYRKTYLDINVDIKLASIVNALRKMVLDDEIANTTEDSETLPNWLEGELDLTTIINTFLNGGLDILTILSLINAEFKIVTQAESYDASTDTTVLTKENTLVRMYFAGSSYTLVCDYVEIESYCEYVSDSAYSDELSD